VKERPAWSSSFAPEAIRAIEPVLPAETITEEWAHGGSTGKGVKVAVVDSGIEADHPAIDGQVKGYLSIRENDDGTLTFDTEPHEDLFGHGTACAGIIRSFAPDCELYSIRVLGRMLLGRASTFAAGLRWAIENGMDVCNMSLGTTKPEFFSVFHELADLAYFRRVMLVTAANNNPVPSFPSVYASVISVASHDQKDEDIVYYNPDPPVEFGGLGIDVRVPWKDKSWVTVTGNSFAAPHVAGLATKILGKHPGLSVFEMKTILRALCANTGPSARTLTPLPVRGRRTTRRRRRRAAR
jgi:subtilisin